MRNNPLQDALKGFRGWNLLIEVRQEPLDSVWVFSLSDYRKETQQTAIILADNKKFPFTKRTMIRLVKKAIKKLKHAKSNS